MSGLVTPSSSTERVEELGRIILAYSEVTERLQQSHEQLQQTVQSLRLELGEKNRQLERRNRLAALGEMAAGIAHEIRNPLGGIQLYASMLGRDVEDRPQALALVKKISAGVKTLDGLVSQVLQFTREITANRAWVCVADLVAQTIDLAAPVLQPNLVVLETDGPKDLRVNVDPLLLGQAMLNLVLNAGEALRGRQDGCVQLRWCASGESGLYLSISDNGPGIEPAVMDKLFNPFFTTKETGTGLGLAIVHRIVEAHDGTISVSNIASEPGHGAVFEIRI